MFVRRRATISRVIAAYHGFVQPVVADSLGIARGVWHPWSLGNTLLRSENKPLGGGPDLKRFVRPLAALLLVAITAFAVAACGGSSSKKTSASGGSSGGSATTSSGGSSSSGSTPTIHMVQGTFPQSLDPGKDYTTQGSETNWIEIGRAHV